MTDEMRAREKAICEVAGIKDIGDLSDGFHTFNQLYYQRMMLFATIVKQNRDRAWKSLRHEDGELCFGGGWFIVGVDTPEWSYTYHYEDNYYSLFDCVELKRSKHWDGHTEKDVTRLLSLPALEKQEQYRWIPVTERLPEEYGEYRITWKTSSAPGKRFIGDAEYEPGLEWDDAHDRFFGEWLLEDYVKAYPDVEVTAWKPIGEPYTEEES